MGEERAPGRDEQLAMLAALLDGDVPLAYRIATSLLSEGVPFDELTADILAPVQHEVGRRWAEGDLGVADEHAATRQSRSSSCSWARRRNRRRGRPSS